MYDATRPKVSLESGLDVFASTISAQDLDCASSLVFSKDLKLPEFGLLFAFLPHGIKPSLVGGRVMVCDEVAFPANTEREWSADVGVDEVKRVPSDFIR